MQPQDGRPSPRGNLALGLVAGVVVGAVLVALAWFAVQPDSDRAVPAGSAVPSASATVDPASSDPTPAATPSAGEPASADPSTSPSPDVSASPDPSATAIPGIVTELPVGSWVTVLKSLPQNSVSAEEAVAFAASVSTPEHQAIVLNTSSFTGLNAGYWAVVIPGADSRAASNQVCQDIGRPVGDTCYPREIKA